MKTMSLVKWLASAVLAVGVSGVAFAGISNTKHNLSSGGPGPNKTSSTDQICVFCHTPHGSDISAPVPLWNKALPAGTSFTTYAALNSSSIDGEILTVGSVSLACLSCHDGTQAMDNILNAPGSGGYTSGGGGATGLNYTWTSGAQTLSGSPIPNLGKDLRNDHPIGIEYCGGGITGSGTTVSGSCKDGDFKRTEMATKNTSSGQVFWVDTSGGVTGTREKTDMILYTRSFSGAVNRPSVECASCHDPHVESKGSDNIMFMRVTTAGSAICLACHTK